MISKYLFLILESTLGSNHVNCEALPIMGDPLTALGATEMDVQLPPLLLEAASTDNSMMTNIEMSQITGLYYYYTLSDCQEQI